MYKILTKSRSSTWGTWTTAHTAGIPVTASILNLLKSLTNCRWRGCKEMGSWKRSHFRICLITTHRYPAVWAKQQWSIVFQRCFSFKRCFPKLNSLMPFEWLKQISKFVLKCFPSNLVRVVLPGPWCWQLAFVSESATHPSVLQF